MSQASAALSDRLPQGRGGVRVDVHMCGCLLEVAVYFVCTWLRLDTLQQPLPSSAAVLEPLSDSHML